MSLTVNRSLKDEMMDHIDHALGRPFDPMAETYRNRYATSGTLADQMVASPFWTESKGWPGDKMRFFHVTESGCKALAEHLRTIEDPHRAFVVSFDGFSRTVAAASRSKARYSHYLDVSDCWSDLTFKDYCRRATVRVA